MQPLEAMKKNLLLYETDETDSAPSFSWLHIAERGWPSLVVAQSIFEQTVSYSQTQRNQRRFGEQDL